MRSVMLEGGQHVDLGGKWYRAEDVDAELTKLRAALAVYADPRHWAIRRNGKTFEDCIWIGPGATDTVPDAPGVAREALK